MPLNALNIPLPDNSGIKNNIKQNLIFLIINLALINMNLSNKIYRYYRNINLIDCINDIVK
jgi:hypothetical protein